MTDPFYHLKGASQYKPAFYSLDSKEVESPNQVIFPILFGSPDGKFESIGTGFFITALGTFATAKHVIDELQSRMSDANSAEFPYVMYENAGSYTMRRIVRTYSATRGDVGVGLLWNADDEQSYMINRYLILSSETATPGSRVATYAFPNLQTFEQPEGKPSGALVTPQLYEGAIVEHYPVKRDSCTVTGPSYRTDMHIHAGASGGPVFDDIGRVFAVNSCSLRFEENISFVSSIEPLFHFNWPYHAHGCGPQLASINAFIKMKVAEIIPPIMITLI